MSTHPLAAAPVHTTAAPYRARRDRVIEAMRHAGGGVAILATAPEVARNRDSDYPYRHDSYFYYLTGFDEPQALLVLDANAPEGTAASILFCRDKDPEREIWDGYRYGPEAARQAFGFDAAYPNEERDARIADQLANAPAIFYALGRSGELDAQVRAWLDAVRARSRSGVVAPQVARDLLPILDEMRLFKDAHELAIMRQAARISAQAHLRTLRACRPGMPEYALEAELLYEFRRQGAQSPAYGSIVAAGANACVLHYPAGGTIARDGDLILIDAACELDGYASDITRTFPANGVFTAPQRELYDIVLAAQEAAIAVTRPGATFDAPHEAALRVLVQGMLDTGLLPRDKHGDVDAVLETRAYTRFYMHRTGHWLGMDVHDCGDYRVPGPAPEGRERPWRTLQPGMALTVEPGLYVRADDDVPERFHDIGIRIEDDAVVTEQGCELLTRDVPVTIADIEAVMAERR